MQQKDLGNLEAHIEEVYSGHNVVKLFNAEKSEGEEFQKINKKLYSRLEKVNSMNYLILGVPCRIILRTIFEELTLPVWDIIIIVSIFF